MKVWKRQEYCMYFGFSNCTVGAKDPAAAADDLISGYLRQWYLKDAQSPPPALARGVPERSDRRGEYITCPTYDFAAASTYQKPVPQTPPVSFADSPLLKAGAGGFCLS